jgi:S-adenosyl-L-methionine hydrolase (adenosine-forming)
MKSRIIAIQTDFGLKDPYVGIMKGRMLSICPDFTFIDLSHEISPFGILSASYHIWSSWHYFPEGTIFLSVVDPGVGTSRKVLLIQSGNRFLVTPDNGTASFIARMADSFEAFHPLDKILDKLVSGSVATFQGRDVFAPLAAFIAKDGIARVKGIECSPLVLQEVYPVIDSSEQKIIGQIIHIDRFGNCIASIHESDLPKIGGISQKRIAFLGNTIGKLHTTYSDVDAGEQIAYIGSAGFLEIGIREGNASEKMRLAIGDEILIA